MIGVRCAVEVDNDTGDSGGTVNAIADVLVATAVAVLAIEVVVPVAIDSKAAGPPSRGFSTVCGP